MISLDANAGSRLRPEALQVIENLSKRSAEWANPSSVHGLGREARKIIDTSRKELLSWLELPATTRVVFTSGGTEGCNSLITGLLGSRKVPAHIVCSSIEHPAVLEPVRKLERTGWEVSWVSASQNGIINIQKILEVIRPQTALVSLMGANNETGAIQPIVKLCSELRMHGYRGYIVSDFCQTLGKSPLNVRQVFDAGLDALVFAGHKLGALQGVGAIVLAPQNANATCTLVELEALIVGGPQEQRLRAGTENVLAIATLGAVAKLLRESGVEEQARIRALRESLWQKIKSQFPGAHRISPEDTKEKIVCLSNTLMLHIPGVRGDDLVAALDLEGVAVSTGSACASGKQESSHVLNAMGFSDELAREAIRLSFDWDADSNRVQHVMSSFEKVLSRFGNLETKITQTAHRAQTSDSKLGGVA